MIRAILVSLCLLTLSLGYGAQSMTIQLGRFTLHGDQWDQELMDRAVEVIHAEQATYVERYGLSLDHPVEIWFHYDPQSLGQHVHAAPYWSSGIARAGREIHVFGRDRTQWLSTLRHELFHTLIAQHGIRIPIWLNEGLAQRQAGQEYWQGFTELGTATVRGALFPLVDLDAVMTFHHKQAALAYAQALDATRFLVERYGKSVLPYLLQPDDRSFKERFLAETGTDLIDFEIAWRDNLEARFWFFRIAEIPGILWTLTPLIVILAWVLRKRRNSKKLEEWEYEEGLKESPRYDA